MTATLLALCAALLSFLAGLRLKHRRFLLVREQLRDATQRISAWKVADTKGDLDVVGPVTGPTNVSRSIDERWDAAVAPPSPQECPCQRNYDGSLRTPADTCAIHNVDAANHLGQACGWSDDGTTTCGEPAVTWAFHANGDRVFLCADHHRWASDPDLDAVEPLPRSLPGRER